MASGRTRPVSDAGASKWRRRYAAIPPRERLATLEQQAQEAISA